MSLKTPQVLKVKEDVYWTGAIDWHIKTFHGYETREGTTYNSFLIMDEKPTLIDSVKAPFCKDMVERVRSLIPLDKIQYIVVNHLEPDHAGSLPELMKLLPNATIVTSGKSLANMEKVLGPVPGNKQAVKTGDKLNIGKRTLSFVETPMLHWPESMMTYSDYDKILFSIDGFGQHYASGKRFDDEMDAHELALVREACIEYMANILGCFGPVIKRCLPAIAALDIETICNAHGVVWRSKEGVDWVVRLYSAFAENKHLRPKVVILFDTMYGSTETMARAIEAGVLSTGAECKAISLSSRGLTEVARETFDAAAVAVGTPALNRGPMPTVAGALSYIGGLDLLKGKSVGVFGSYGWAPMAVGGVMKTVEGFGGVKVMEPVTQNWKCDDAVLERCVELGKQLGEKAIAAAK